MVMYHLTCYGWLIFRARSARQLVGMSASLFTAFHLSSVNVEGILVPVLMYTTPLILVHACEAWHDDLLIVPRLPAGVRYSVYAATFYLTMLFGNFGGAEFIYFQF
jgi:alginate O-acetyltransferase complex protein AlgI